MERQAVGELPPDGAKIVHAAKALLLACFDGDPHVLVLDRAPRHRKHHQQQRQLRRQQPPYRPDFPGGESELDPITGRLETPRATVVRETSQETGLELPEGAFREIHTVGPIQKRRGLWITRYLLYAVVAYEGDPLPDIQTSEEHVGSWWMQPARLAHTFKDTHWVPGIEAAHDMDVFTPEHAIET